MSHCYLAKNQKVLTKLTENQLSTMNRVRFIATWTMDDLFLNSAVFVFALFVMYTDWSFGIDE